MLATLQSPWLFWALLSAGFAALTAIFAKIGVAEVNADFATLVRTVVILLVLGGIVLGTGQWQSPGSVPGRTWLFLVLSGVATGASWLCYFRALKLGDAGGAGRQAQRRAGGPVRQPVPGREAFGRQLAGRGADRGGCRAGGGEVARAI